MEPFWWASNLRAVVSIARTGDTLYSRTIPPMSIVRRSVIFSLFVGLSLGVTPAQNISPVDYADLTWRCIGPFDGGPVASVEGIAGKPGIYTITTPSGGAWKTIDGGDNWTSVDRASVTRSSSDPHRWIDAANPRRIVRTEAQGIGVSLDAGKTWMSSHNLPIAEVARLTGGKGRKIADTLRPGLVFAGTDAGVEVSFDNGVRWSPLQLNMPGVAINDLEIRDNNLIAATQGRSTWMLEDITPLRQLTAAIASAPATLFKPAEALRSSGGIAIDYVIGPASRPPLNKVTLEIIDATGRVVHTATSAPLVTEDRWLPLMRSLSAAPGHHRVIWNLRLDPPASPNHRYAYAAREALLEMPADPEGPRVLAGTYRVRLTAGRVSQLQPLIVRNDPKASAADLQADRQKFQLAMKSYDVMQTTHRAFLQTTRVRNGLKPLLLSNDLAILMTATNLYMRIASLDGSDWTGLVIPDSADESPEIEEELLDVKHPDFVPPKPVSVSKDYDDPASILGRVFENVNHPPALLILNASLADFLIKTTAAHVAPDALALDTYDQSCREVAGVLDMWRAINAQDLPRFNIELAKRKLTPLPLSTAVPTLTCGAAK